MDLVYHGMIVLQSGVFASPGLQIESLVCDHSQVYTPWQFVRIFLFVSQTGCRYAYEAVVDWPDLEPSKSSIAMK